VRTALAEKEILLRELYHRTKNNMQVIYSMLSIQADRVADERMREVFTATQNRILSMSLVHQKLYQEQNLSRISLDAYIRELAQLLMENYASTTNPVELAVTTQEMHVLIDTALPCGLIVNELITNSLQHAFPDGKPGKIIVELQRLEDNEIVLQVSDNGIGLPQGFDVKQADSLGLLSINALARQLQGEVVFSGKQGVTCRVRFRDDLYKARI
jgi:two-component sensor histidine kinase